MTPQDDTPDSTAAFCMTADAEEVSIAFGITGWVNFQNGRYTLKFKDMAEARSFFRAALASLHQDGVVVGKIVNLSSPPPDADVSWWENERLRSIFGPEAVGDRLLDLERRVRALEQRPVTEPTGDCLPVEVDAG